MDAQRQQAFRKLRPVCVELSSTALGFRTRQNEPSDVQKALDELYDTLRLSQIQEALDAKLAEYIFFPLSQVFNQAQSLPQRCLEVSIKCIEILVAQGWQNQLAPDLGKQLLILMTILVGGTPAQKNAQPTLKTDSEELSIASFSCMDSIFQMLQGPVAEKTIFNDIGSATIVDQTVYLLLEGISEGASSSVQLAALGALRSLLSRVTDRVVLASIMPRVISALTKIIKPTTKIRRTSKILEGSLNLFEIIIRAVLNDKDATDPKRAISEEKSSEKLVLDEAWLTATTGQIKLALANVVPVRQHERQAVREALLSLCVMIVEECSRSLKESLPLIVETIVVLSGVQDDNGSNHAYNSLLHLATVQSQTIEVLKDLLHVWTTSFKRIMQSNDEVAKQRAIKQITIAFQLLSQTQSHSSLLESNVALGLCDSVVVVVQSSKSAPMPVHLSSTDSLELAVVGRQTTAQTFPPVLLERRSQQQTLTDMISMVNRLNGTQSGSAITRYIINQIHQASGDGIIAPLWLSLQFLRSEGPNDVDEFLSFDTTDSLSSRNVMVEELYSVALPILNEPPTPEPRDWRISALALEAVALQAQQLKEGFRLELIDALYPVLQFLASNDPNLQTHAVACLNIITQSCNYSDTRTMILENVDYLVNAVAIKLNTFDVSPYPPQVLLMMVKLSGAALIPYLDDLVSSIFGILDMYHGYPRLVELLYSSLAAIVEEGTKSPELLAITEDGQENLLVHDKQAFKPISVAKLADHIALRKSRRTRVAELDSEIDEGRASSYPRRPWTRELDGSPLPKDEANVEELLEKANLNPVDEVDESLPPPKDPEDAPKPLSKSHSLLLQIVKSIPPHLGSPSPYLRRSLLNLLCQAFPVLSRNQGSFLPLINELWPTISIRIASPPATNSTPAVYLSSSQASSSITTATTSQTTAISNIEGDNIIKEETYVTAAACNAVTSMCALAGDFMASRVSAEYPRWRRLYRENWTKVLVNAEKNLTRRNQQRISSTQSTQPAKFSMKKKKKLALNLSDNTARSFTQHHILWRSLLALFINVLAHVRVSAAMGDEISEIIGEWIVNFMGPKYYFTSYRQRTALKRDQQQQPLPSEPSEVDDEDLQIVDKALQAMEVWNRDITWFIFWQAVTAEQSMDANQKIVQKQGTATKTKVSEIKDNPSSLPMEMEMFNLQADRRGGLKFAVMEVN